MNIMKILLDTNFLMMPAQFKVDIYQLLKGKELCTLDLCVAELEELSKGKGKNASAAKIALGLLRKNNIKIINAEGAADAALIEFGKRGKYIIGTNDAELIESLKRYGVKILRLKQKKFLSEE